MRIGLVAVLAAVVLGCRTPQTAASHQFHVTIDPELATGPVTGRLIVAVSTREDVEPRTLISPVGPAIFGVDVEGLVPGKPVVVDADAASYPVDLAELPPGEYFVQALLRVYTQVTRSDGHTIWVPFNDGTMEGFGSMAGNLASEVRRVSIGGDRTRVDLSLSRILPKTPRPPDTEWVKRLSIRSERLSAFWGRDVFIHANVLLPRGYHDNETTRYPTLFVFGHRTPFRFTTDSVGPGIGRVDPVSGMESGFDFQKSWRADDFPRIVAITFEQKTPYFSDSYSINSANNGPYGDALVEDIIPELERRFRLIGQPYARHLEGASTGGWQTLALQLNHPDFFGGAWILQPDPIDFSRYVLSDIYQDENAFSLPHGQFGTIERPLRRTAEGQVVLTMRQASRYERVLGSKSRSTYQLSGWEAIYGPVGSDGYPKPLWDPVTGQIDRTVAHYMRDNGYDLARYLERNWKTLGPKLAGKLHFFAGDMDDFYLNLAIYRMEDLLRGFTDPRSDATFVYGRPMKGHSWHDWTWAEFVRLVYPHMQPAR